MDWTVVVPIGMGLLWFAWKEPGGYRRLYAIVLPVLMFLAAWLAGAINGFEVAQTATSEALIIFGYDAQTIFNVVMAIAAFWIVLLFAHHFKGD